MKAVFDEFGLADELLVAKEIALKDMLMLEDGDLQQKVDALAEVLDPVTVELAQISGLDFVHTMSQEALEFYSEATAYWAKEGNLTAFGSVKWGTKIPPKANPNNAVKCAAQKGKCECHAESLVYYGLKAADGKLDTSVNYAIAEADHTGYTFCKNEFFGDPLPGDSRKKYCFCDESIGFFDAAIVNCAKQGSNCKCEIGGTIIYGQTNTVTNSIDITKDHWELDAPNDDSLTKCSPEKFGAPKTTAGSCYCELP